MASQNNGQPSRTRRRSRHARNYSPDLLASIDNMTDMWEGIPGSASSNRNLLNEGRSTQSDPNVMNGQMQPDEDQNNAEDDDEPEDERRNFPQYTQQQVGAQQSQTTEPTHGFGDSFNPPPTPGLSETFGRHNISAEERPTSSEPTAMNIDWTAEQGDADTQDENNESERERQRQLLILEAVENERNSIPTSALEAEGIDITLPMPIEQDNISQRPIKPLRARKIKSNLFLNLALYPELFVEVAKHLRPKDFIILYSICKPFHDSIDGHMCHSMVVCAKNLAPESASVYHYRFYSALCIDDPMARASYRQSENVKKVPGLCWLQMVFHREKTVRDILACMAREGHRMPKGMSYSLKKMWLLMDISTNAHRAMLLHSNLFEDMDLYNIQLFIVKLDMRFNDPVDGPGREGLRKLFLGQRGLAPLMRLLKREQFLSVEEVIKLGIRYAYSPRQEHRGYPILNIPPHEIGIAHLEGWGRGRVHLMRPDELVVWESVRRRLNLKQHIMEMMLWGYVDPITGEDIAVTDEEKYMSDDEEKPDPRARTDYSDPKGRASLDEDSDDIEEDEEEDDEDGDEDDDEDNDEDDEEDDDDDDEDDYDDQDDDEWDEVDDANLDRLMQMIQ
jgi:hypothetical protein